MSSSDVTSARCAVAATAGSSAATTRWPSVCPSGTSRTPAETQFATSAWRKAASAGASGMSWPAAAAATAQRALVTTLDDMGASAFRADLASLRHETQYTRLFRS